MPSDRGAGDAGRTARGVGHGSGHGARTTHGCVRECELCRVEYQWGPSGAKGINFLGAGRSVIRKFDHAILSFGSVRCERDGHRALSVGCQGAATRSSTCILRLRGQDAGDIQRCVSGIRDRGRNWRAGSSDGDTSEGAVISGSMRERYIGPS